MVAVTGGVFWSDSEDYDAMDKDGVNNFVIVLGNKGSLIKVITTALKDNEKDEDPFDDTQLTAYFADAMTPAQIGEIRGLLTAKFKRDSPDAQAFDQAYDENHVLVGRTNGKVVVGYYLSPHGIATTTTKGGSKDDAIGG